MAEEVVTAERDEAVRIPEFSEEDVEEQFEENQRLFRELLRKIPRG